MAADPVTSRTVNDLMAEDMNADFDFDDDPFASPKPTRPTERDQRDDKPTLSPRKRKAVDDNAFGGNINEEIKITKPRVKIPKLDADRLCSQPGIPKMRELLRSGQLKKKLRLKGKGHEFSDMARLLNYYQMWLDNLYPRAKFADALQLVEKAGHGKRMQVMRKAWIDEGKPGYVRREDVDKAVDAADNAPNAEARTSEDDALPKTMEQEEDPASMFFGNDNAEDGTEGADGPNDDELDALLAQDGDKPANTQNKPLADVDSEGEDDLDAILAEQDTRRKPSQIVEDNEDEDDLEALLNDSFNEQQQKIELPNPKALESEPPTAEEEDDLDAILNEDPSADTPKHTQPAPTQDDLFDHFNDEDLDDMNTLLPNNPSTNDATEPDLPPLTSATPAKLHPSSKSATDITPDSEAVPELDNIISSSPIPNVQTDELDELMDEHDAKTKQNQIQSTLKKGMDKDDDTQLLGEFMSSSPIPNEESQ